MALTRALGGASPDDNIRVVGINPGPILTDRIESLLRRRAQDRLGDAERWGEMMAEMPFGRAGRVDEWRRSSRSWPATCPATPPARS